MITIDSTVSRGALLVIDISDIYLDVYGTRSTLVILRFVLEQALV